MLFFGINRTAADSHTARDRTTGHAACHTHSAISSEELSSAAQAKTAQEDVGHWLRHREVVLRDGYV